MTLNWLRKAMVTGLGTGYMPIAPGTWGSAAVTLIFLAVAFGADSRAICVFTTMAIVVVVSSIVCVALGGFAESAYGKKDASQCTIDEWAGQALTYMFLPLSSEPIKLLAVAGVGFFAFRLFDIVKPPPARQLEKLPRGWGVLTDDLAAGVYANITAQLILRLWFL